MLRRTRGRAGLRESRVLGAAERLADVSRFRAASAEPLGSAATSPSARELQPEIERARRDGLIAACVDAEANAGLPRGLLLAVASRESGCRNIVGDKGHGRGVFQIDDRFHSDWLRQHGAGEAGTVPSVGDGAAYAAELLRGNLAFGRGKGLRGRKLLKFAVSAYNAGPGGAWKAVQEQGDPDAGTTGRNYGADVLQRLSVVRGWLGPDDVDRRARRRPVLRRGDVGPDVLELKRKLRAWFEANQPVAMPEFKVNTSYGPALVTAIEVFQRTNGLDVDGVAGRQVWGVLDRSG